MGGGYHPASRRGVTAAVEAGAVSTPRLVESDADVAACWPVMRLLRPHLASAEAFADRVARQRTTGYRLSAVWEGNNVVAVAGWRVQENLLHGRHLFVDDLAALEARRGQGFGSMLLAALKVEGRLAGCDKLVLGTALANVLAHRFYYRHGLLATGLGFSGSLVVVA